ncbi:hypothetical protein LINPERHAP2_LOCUS25322 [Linum perenne]
MAALTQIHFPHPSSFSQSFLPSSSSSEPIFSLSFPSSSSDFKLSAPCCSSIRMSSSPRNDGDHEPLEQFALFLTHWRGLSDRSSAPLVFTKVMLVSTLSTLNLSRRLGFPSALPVVGL